MVSSIYILLMIFPLYNAIESLDHNQIEAARDLGAPWWRIHYRVVMPHAKAPHVAATIARTGQGLSRRRNRPSGASERDVADELCMASVSDACGWVLHRNAANWTERLSSLQHSQTTRGCVPTLAVSPGVVV